MTDENMGFLERLQKRGGGDQKELAEAVLDCRCRKTAKPRQVRWRRLGIVINF
jgi:hypothetical protein